MNKNIDEELDDSKELDTEVESIARSCNTSKRSARKMVEQRREMKELRDLLDDPLFDLGIE
jgi:uncharacterized protein YjiS (DUF1127 family)